MVQYRGTSETVGFGNEEPRYLNTTEMDVIVDNLRPATEYEFSVKVIKGLKSSDWSLAAVNSTFPQPSQSYPQDLTLMAITS